MLAACSVLAGPQVIRRAYCTGQGNIRPPGLNYSTTSAECSQTLGMTAPLTLLRDMMTAASVLEVLVPRALTCTCRYSAYRVHKGGGVGVLRVQYKGLAWCGLVHAVGYGASGRQLEGIIRHAARCTRKGRDPVIGQQAWLGLIQAILRKGMYRVHSCHLGACKHHRSLMVLITKSFSASML